LRHASRLFATRKFLRHAKRGMAGAGRRLSGSRHGYPDRELFQLWL